MSSEKIIIDDEIGVMTFVNAFWKPKAIGSLQRVMDIKWLSLLKEHFDLCSALECRASVTSLGRSNSLLPMSFVSPTGLAYGHKPIDPEAGHC
jgi:hypothetical protein